MDHLIDDKRPAEAMPVLRRGREIITLEGETDEPSIGAQCVMHQQRMGGQRPDLPQAAANKPDAGRDCGVFDASQKRTMAGLMKLPNLRRESPLGAPNPRPWSVVDPDRREAPMRSSVWVHKAGTPTLAFIRQNA